jgi:diguanylate cyclase (GGDEF)-like protein
MTLLYLDCDEFKAINDRHGHPARNRLLARIAATLTENTRAMDVVGRLGGDEFAVLLVETTSELGTEVAARLQRAMRSVLGPEAPAVTFSIGAMTFDSPPANPTEALRVADALMYEAKRAGKDRVVHAIAG